jgi:hypothetical protein
MVCRTDFADELPPDNPGGAGRRRTSSEVDVSPDVVNYIHRLAMECGWLELPLFHSVKKMRCQLPRILLDSNA